MAKADEPDESIDGVSEPSEDVLTLEQTVWDVTPLCFLRLPCGGLFLPRAHIMQTVFLLIVNFLVQVSYCWWAVGYIRTRTISIGKIEGALWIRLTQWHHFSNLHYPTMETMAVRTCKQEVWTILEDVYQDTSSYLSSWSWTAGSLPGAAMTILALLVWTLAMTGEMHRTIKIAWIIGKMEPENDNMPGTKVKRDGDAFVVTNMSRKSKFLIIYLVQLPRLLVAVGLLFVGLWFLGTTYQTEDLLLNAVAFQVIKDVDELLFAALAPADLSRRLSSVTLKSTRPQMVNSLYKSSTFWLFRVGFVVLVLIICNYALMVDLEETVQSLSEKICGGQKEDFTWTLHPISNFPVLTGASREEVEGARLDELTCFYQAQYKMLQVYAGFDETDANTTSLIDGGHDFCKRNPNSCGFVDFSSLRILYSFDRTAALLDQAYCQDHVVALHLTKSNCTGTKHSELSKVLHSIESCLDVANLFECQAGATCSYANPGKFEKFSGVYQEGLSGEWMQILLNICPKTVGLCDEMLLSESANSSSRRLDSSATTAMLHNRQPGLPPSWLTDPPQAGPGSFSSAAWPASGGGGTVSAMDAEGRIQRLERESTELAQQLHDERQRTQEVVQRLESANAVLARQVEELQKTVLAISSQMRTEATSAHV